MSPRFMPKELVERVGRQSRSPGNGVDNGHTLLGDRVTGQTQETSSGD